MCLTWSVSLPKNKTGWLGKLIFLLSTIGVGLILTSCVPTCVSTGFRELGILPPEKYLNKVVIAVESTWRCNGMVHTSVDGGLTWKEIGLEEPWYNDAKLVGIDCDVECEIIDPQLETVHYRIATDKTLPGKILSQSLDNGNTWVELLQVPAWNVRDKIFIDHMHAIPGFTPNLARGPFSAITDWKTGTIIVAMGYEGFLIKPKGGQWNWIEVNDYTKVNNSRFDMVRLIKTQDWWRGPIIGLFLMLVGINRLGFSNNKLIGATVKFLALWYVFLPFGIIIFLLYYLLHWYSLEFTNEGLYLQITALVYIVALSSLIWVKIKKAWKQKDKPIRKIIIISGLAAASYWLFLILWSQGLFLWEYSYARLIGLLTFIIAYFLVRNIAKRTGSETQPRQFPRTESSDITLET